MILAVLILAQGLAPGDAWTFERTYRYINEEKGIDFGDIERSDVKVSAVRPGGYDLTLSRRIAFTKKGETESPADESVSPVEQRWAFGTNGQPQNPIEDGSHLIRARIDRMLWTASELRSGLSWSRVWKLKDKLPEGKVTVRPGTDGSLAVTYTEGTTVRGEGVALRDKSRPVIYDLSATLRGVQSPDGTVPVTVAVKQRPWSR